MSNQFFLKKKKKNSQIFWQADQWISRFNYATNENFKTIWTYPPFQETALKFMNVIGHLHKTWESFVLRKYYDLTIFFQMSRFQCPHCNRKQYETQTPEMPLYRQLPKTEPQQINCIKVSWFVRWLTTITLDKPLSSNGHYILV